jgi:hypothetical protein
MLISYGVGYWIFSGIKINNPQGEPPAVVQINQKQNEPPIKTEAEPIPEKLIDSADEAKDTNEIIDPAQFAKPVDARFVLELTEKNQQNSV